MTIDEIQEIGRQLRVRGQISVLHGIMRMKRPTISKDTIYRAFDNPECDTLLLNDIRQEGKHLLIDTEKKALAAA